MMFADPQTPAKRMTFEEFLDFVDANPGVRWELWQGRPILVYGPHTHRDWATQGGPRQVVGMAGGTARHSLIVGNLFEAVGPVARKNGCRAMRDVFVQLAASDGPMFDPDLFVRCGPLDDSLRHVSDPVIVFEVLSPSTMNRDRGDKLQAYLQCATLQTLVLVYQDQMRVEVWQRGSEEAFDPAPLMLARSDQTLSLPAIDTELSLATIYEGVDVPASTGGPLRTALASQRPHTFHTTLRDTTWHASP